MKVISENGIKFLQGLEGCCSKIRDKNIPLNEIDLAKNSIIVYPYKCSAGCVTIGYGTRIYDDNNKLIYKNTFENGITLSKCTQLLKDKLTEFETLVNKWLTVNVNQNQFDALICLCYNRPIWAKKIIIEFINTYYKDDVDKIVTKWINMSTVQKQLNRGLLNRRQKECELYFSN